MPQSAIIIALYMTAPKRKNNGAPFFPFGRRSLITMYNKSPATNPVSANETFSVTVTVNAIITPTNAAIDCMNVDHFSLL